MQKKYQIFVSSTFRDLVDERQDAIRNILDLGHIPAGMELFPAADTEQLTYIKKVIDECDYYLLIVGGRYGSLDAEGVSFTEREYDYAVAAGKTVLAFVHGEASSIPVGKSDIAPELILSLNNFRAKVITGRLVREWKTREALEPMVLKALINAFQAYPATGWVRADAVASEELLVQVNELHVQNNELKSEVKSLKAATQPMVENLADLNEEVELRFSYKKAGYNSTYTESVKLTWAQIFVAVSPDIMAPRSPAMIGIALAKHIKENLNFATTSLSVLDSDLFIVRNQLMALGFIKSYNGNKIGGGISEFVIVTGLGQNKLIDLTAVRSAGSPPVA